MKVVWRRKERQSTQRFEGVKKRWKREKKKDPTQKEAREVRDLIHRFEVDGEVIPRPI